MNMPQKTREYPYELPCFRYTCLGTTNIPSMFTEHQSMAI